MSTLQASPPAVASSRVFARYAWAAVLYNVAVALWGAFVRATGSGAGCGNHWPLCNGEVTPTSPSVHTLIEFTHRAMTGLDVPIIALLLWGAFRTFPRKHPVRMAAVLSVVFLVSEALIGAALVKLQHVARNADAYSLSLHLVNTLTLLACLAMTAWFAGHDLPRPMPTKFRLTACITLAAVMFLSVTGVIAALGDTLFPATSVAAGIAQDFDPASSALLRLRAIHPLFAAAVAAWLTIFGVSRLRDARRPALFLVILVWVQLLAGLCNMLLLAPVYLQLLHLLLAYSVWIALLITVAQASAYSRDLARP